MNVTNEIIKMETTKNTRETNIRDKMEYDYKYTKWCEKHKQSKLSFKDFQYMNLKRRERRIKFYDEFNNRLKKVLNLFPRHFGMFMKMLMIGLIAGLAGMQSKALIYALNKPFGMGYAHFASYIEAGLIGAILFSYIFSNKGGNKKE